MSYISDERLKPVNEPIVATSNIQRVGIYFKAFVSELVNGVSE